MEDPGSKTGRSIWLRILAAVLLAVFVLSLYLNIQARIIFSGSQFVGKVAEYAAGVTEDTTGYLTEGRLERAWDVLTTLVKKPRTYDQYETYASIAIAREDYENAIQYMQGCVDTYDAGNENELAVLELRLASLYVLTGKYGEALTHLDRAVAHDRDLGTAYFMRAEMKMILGDMDGATADVKKYLELDGGDPVIMVSLGQLYESTGEPARAAECYALAVDDQPHSYVDMARCLILTEDLTQARQCLEKFRTVSSEDANGEVSAMMGVCLMNDREYTRAAEEFHTAVANGYSAVHLMYEQAMMCFYLSEDFGNAATDGRKAVEAKKAAGEPVASAAVWTGLSLLMLGEHAEARSFFETAKEEDDSTQQVRYYLGLCDMSLGEYESAVQLFTESMDRGESITACLYNRGVCRAALGDTKAARQDLNLVVKRNDDAELTKQAQELLRSI
jgi:tetratricopeptide (TPR) repeat protein